MEIIFLLIPLALVMLGIAIAAFIWAVRSDQFDDLEREAQRILFDEDSLPAATRSTQDGSKSNQDKQQSSNPAAEKSEDLKS